MYNCGIYQILNLKNGKSYIGQSVQLNIRKGLHFFYLKNKKHQNKHLQNAWNKYGLENFVFKILIYCERFELLKYEKYFDNYYKKLGLSYNIRECVESNKGLICTTETKSKISKTNGDGRLAKEKNPMFGIHRNDSDNPMFGKTHSNKSKQKISQALKGKQPHNKGKKHSEETKKKMSESGKNKIFTREHRENLSKAKIGKPSNRWKNRKENK